MCIQPFLPDGGVDDGFDGVDFPLYRWLFDPLTEPILSVASCVFPRELLQWDIPHEMDNLVPVPLLCLFEPLLSPSPVIAYVRFKCLRERDRGTWG